ncbi:unnamed protein product [Blepharisma stoltei]|uniref:Uncharacterized protein n=1 Tax=Blepharisma stoltei TaxID=1481888 RepID=A0AAU9JZ24_9CILI|nr:unnamed protein product [Blepharisma stoltei]
MESPHCYIPDCSRRSDFKCSCLSSEVFSCTLHFGNHISSTDSSISHQFKKLYEKPNDETKKAAIAHLIQKMTKLKEYQREVVEKSNEKMQKICVELRKELNFVYEEIKKIKKYAAQIVNIKDIPVENAEPLYEILKYPSQGVAEKIEEIINGLPKVEQIDEPLLEPLNQSGQLYENASENNLSQKIKAQLWEISKLSNEIKEKTKIICENEQMIKNLTEENEKLKIDIKSRVSHDELSEVEANLKENRIKGQFAIESFSIEALQLVTPVEDSQSVIITNLSNSERFQIDLEIEETLSSQISVCMLPDLKLFFYGNCWEKKTFIFKSQKVYSGITFIFDLCASKANILEKGFDCCEAGCIYYSNKVYVFGGFNGESLSLARRYNLDLNKWSDLIEMPEPSTRVSCAMFQKAILLCGSYHTVLYRYEIINKAYVRLGLNLYEGSNKIVCVANERGYVIEMGYGIYESEFRDVRKWHVLGKCNLSSNFKIISHGILFEKSIFFHMFDDFDQALIEFNLESKKLENRGRIAI